MPRSTLFAYMIFIKKNNEINESYKLCQVRGKHTVGGIVFYKHLFLVLFGRSTIKWRQCPHMTIAVDWDAEPQIKQTVFPGLAKNLLGSCS